MPCFRRPPPRLATFSRLTGGRRKHATRFSDIISVRSHKRRACFSAAGFPEPAPPYPPIIPPRHRLPPCANRRVPIAGRPMPSVPKIPGYDLLACLGGGPMTCVYSARDCAADSLCAIKLARPSWEDQATAVKLLQREARAALAV